MSYTDFAWHTMPNTRMADYQLTYDDGSVFLDFDNKDNAIQLVRISFDGYGCCDVSSEPITPLCTGDQELFQKMYDTNNIDQVSMYRIISRTLGQNRRYLWNDALEEYMLLGEPQNS